MADQPANKKGAEKAKASEPTKGKKKPIILVIVAVVALILIGVAGKALLGGGKSKPKKAEVGVNLAMDEFLVNLAGGGEHYLRANLTLGIKKGIAEEQTKDKVAPMRDAILSILCSKSLHELNNIKVRDSLKKEIKDKVNAAVGDDIVVEVYFTAFATQ